MKSIRLKLEAIRPLLQEAMSSSKQGAGDAGSPACVLFFCVSDGLTRASVQTVSAEHFELAWQAGESWLTQWQASHEREAVWLRVEQVSEVQRLNWSALKKKLGLTKRNYFRYGLAFARDFSVALLEQELAANAILYDGKLPTATPNPVNLSHYARLRFRRDLKWPQSDATPLWRFRTRAVFADESGARLIEYEGRNSGYRRIENWGPDCVRQVIGDSSAYLARQVKESGQYEYGWFPCFDRAIPTYNALRHASSTYALLEAWEVTQAPEQEQAIRRALDYLETTLIRRVTGAGGQTLAFLVDEGEEIKLGGNAVCLLAFSKYAELTGDRRHLPLMAQLAEGMLHMQDESTGAFVHVLNYPDLSVKERHRIIYYDGEAAFGLMRLYGLSRDERWLQAVEKAFDYFIAAKHWQAHDHWLSYCVNELTQYRPALRYYQFGLDNVRGHLDFVRDRITTFPTLLELMMAARRMITRMQQDDEASALLQGFPLQTFHEALEARARYLLSGFFWPELAMFFKNPARILHGFYIRHHSFRVRIDDVEHYLSGYVAYLDYLNKRAESNLDSVHDKAIGDVLPPPEKQGPVLAWAGDVNLGRRQHYRTAQLGAERVLDVPALKEADLAVVNLECVVATRGEQGVQKGEGGPYYYRGRPEMLQVLLKAGVDAVVTANNHAGDYGPEALLEQSVLLDAMGIAHVGSGADRDAAFQPLLREVGGVRVALFAVDFTQRRFAADTATPGTAYLNPRNPAFITKFLASRIKAVRDQVHVVLVAAHYGLNQVSTPSEADVAVARAIVDAGADAVLGSSAHELQGMEIYQGRPIIHDAGDLLFDASGRKLESSGVFQLSLSTDGVTRVTFVPVGKGFGQSVQRQGQDAMEGARAYAARCREMGTEVSLTSDGRVFVSLAPPARATALSAWTPPRRRVVPPLVMQRNAAWTAPTVPEDACLQPIRLGPLVLLGVRTWPRVFTGREMLWVESFWCASEPVMEDVRLDFRAEPMQPTRMPPWGVAMDHDPCDWMMPTSRWKPGVIYRDLYGLRPPYLKDWENVPLQLQVGLVSALYRVPRVALPHTFELAVPGKDPFNRGERGDLSYTTEFPSALDACEPGQTWTAEQLAGVTGGKWLVPPPEGWFVKSVVAGNKHIGLVPAPTLFIGHDSFDRCKHEGSKPPQSNFDRHKVVVSRAGDLAGALISDQGILPALPAGFPVLAVEDPIKALIELGLAARQRYQGDVVAVTGTAGKSTTVGMLQLLLGGEERVLASFDNYNSRVGAPALLANLNPDHAAVVVEVAQSALWMRRGPVTRLLKPTVALITELGVSQTDARVKSVADTAKWKSRVFDGLTGAAVAVVGDHLPCLEQVMGMARKHAQRVVVYGRSPSADIRLESVEPDEEGSWINVRLGETLVRARVPLPGQGMVSNALAALAVAYVLGHDPNEAAARLALYEASAGRMVRKEINMAGTSLRIIDDSFNATVTSFQNALSVFKDASPGSATGRKVAVLGRIVHLGELAKPLHEALAAPLLASGVSHVVTHGDEMQYLRAVLPQELLGPHFSGADAMVSYLRGFLADHDLVLFKGSRRNSDFGRVCELLQRSAAVKL